jgi:hypothetical protein
MITYRKGLTAVCLLILVFVGVIITSVGQEAATELDMPSAIEFLTTSFYGDTTGYEEFIHPDWQWMGNGGLQFEGHEGYLNAIGFWSAVFPDIEVETVHFTGEGDVWAIGYHIVGTNTVDFPPMGVTATGNALDFYTNAFIYLEDGMIKDCYLTWDWIGWYDALGIPYSSDAEEE